MTSRRRRTIETALLLATIGIASVGAAAQEPPTQGPAAVEIPADGAGMVALRRLVANPPAVDHPSVHICAERLKWALEGREADEPQPPAAEAPRRFTIEEQRQVSRWVEAVYQGAFERDVPLALRYTVQAALAHAAPDAAVRINTAFELCGRVFAPMDLGVSLQALDSLPRLEMVADAARAALSYAFAGGRVAGGKPDPMAMRMLDSSVRLTDLVTIQALALDAPDERKIRALCEGLTGQLVAAMENAVPEAAPAEGGVLLTRPRMERLREQLESLAAEAPRLAATADLRRRVVVGMPLLLDAVNREDRAAAGRWFSKPIVLDADGQSLREWLSHKPGTVRLSLKSVGLPSPDEDAMNVPMHLVAELADGSRAVVLWEPPVQPKNQSFVILDDED